MINPLKESKPCSWRQQLRHAIRDPAQLARRLNLPEVACSEGAARQFKVFATESYLQRMTPGDPQDPLLKQVLPLADELFPQPANFNTDPLHESQASKAKGILHKYTGRALIITTGACAIHCRYCFRRHFPYSDHNQQRPKWDTALQYIEQDQSIHEVILSGGDPLMLHEEDLSYLTGKLEAIPHVDSIRVHTRLPIVIPDRVDDALIDWLDKCRLPVTIVLHANHAREISPEVASSCRRLKASVKFLLNQAVLLAGVNDSVPALKALSYKLFDAGILPYYLHLLDPVSGTAHFLVTDDRAREIVAMLRASLPGYLVPRLARETPGETSKTVVC